jgi:hypothetical protein
MNPPNYVISITTDNIIEVFLLFLQKSLHNQEDISRV